MAEDKKKPFIQSFIEMKKDFEDKKAKKNAKKNAKKDAKDENAKIDVLDTLDPQTLVLKQNLIGPSFEDMSRSKTYQLAGNEKRPLSHTAKAAVAAASAPLADYLTGKIAKGIKAAKSAKTVSKVSDAISSMPVEEAAKASGTIQKAERAGNIGKAVEKIATNNDLKEAAETAREVMHDTSYALDAHPEIRPTIKKGFSEALTSIKKAVNENEKIGNMLIDYIDGMPEADLIKKYGTKTTKLVPHPTAKNGTKTAVRAYELSDDMYDAIKAMNNLTENEEIVKFIEGHKNLIKNGDFMSYLAENIDKMSPEEAYKNFYTSYDFSAKKPLVTKNTNESFSQVNKALENALIKSTKEAVDETSKYGGQIENIIKGAKVLKDDKARSAAVSKILNKAKKENKYLKEFKSILDFNDSTFYKILNKTDPENYALAKEFEKLTENGHSISDIIQEVAIDKLINKYDKEYMDAVKKLGKSGNTKLPESIIRNADGTLKDVDKIVDIIIKDPEYKTIINDTIAKLATPADLRATALGVKAGTGSFLQHYIARTGNMAKSKPYGAFSPETAEALRPWDPEAELTKGQAIWNALKKMTGIEFDIDPSRYTKSDLNAMKEALRSANKWRDAQVDGWSDEEVLYNLRALGNGKYGEKAKSNVLTKLEELAPRLEEKK